MDMRNGKITGKEMSGKEAREKLAEENFTSLSNINKILYGQENKY